MPDEPTHRDAARFIIEASRDIETILEDKFGAVAQGLAAKADETADVLGDSVAEQIRFLAAVRAKLGLDVATSTTDVPLARFDETRREVLRALDRTEPVRGVEQKRARRRARETSRVDRQWRPNARVSRARVLPLIALGVAAVVAYALLALRRPGGHRSAQTPAPGAQTTAR